MLLGMCIGCATSAPVRMDQGKVPDRLVDLERNVLEDSLKFKALLEEEGAVYEAPVLQAYLDRLFRSLIPSTPSSSAPNFNVKVIRDPTVNAYTLLDGTIYVNTGLIARLKTSHQLAFVLGHELAHLLNRDLLYFTDQLHRKTVAAKLTGLVMVPALSAVGLGGVGNLGLGAVYAASVTGYGREREDAADAESVRMMRRCGYREAESVGLFEALLAEHDRYQQGLEISFFSSHPSNQHRLSAVKTLLGGSDELRASAVELEFLKVTKPLRLANAVLNLKLDRYDHALQDLQLILRHFPQEAEAHYYLGETYRLIAQHPKKLRDELSEKAWKGLNRPMDNTWAASWQAQAIAAYRQAMTNDPTLADPYRGLGLLYEAQGHSPEAVNYLRRYLEMHPSAPDRRFIASTLARLQQPPAAQGEAR